MLVTSLVALLPFCAPSIDPSTALRLIQAESAGQQFAININGPFRLSRQARTYAEFEQLVLALDAGGHNFDFGFVQANNREVRRRGYAVSAKIDPCSNLGFLQEVLAACFQAAPRSADAQRIVTRMWVAPSPVVRLTVPAAPSASNSSRVGRSTTR